MRLAHNELDAGEGERLPAGFILLANGPARPPFDRRRSADFLARPASKARWMLAPSKGLRVTVGRSAVFRLLSAGYCWAIRRRPMFAGMRARATDRPRLVIWY